jgi:hypothetical protein
MKKVIMSFLLSISILGILPVLPLCPPPRIPPNVLMVTTSLLQKTPEFEAAVNEYQSVLFATEILTASYIELDSDECLDTYGVKADDPENWEEIQDVLEVIVSATDALYVMILGGPAVVPRPALLMPADEEGSPPSGVPSDAWYVDFNGDQIVDEGLSISRLPGGLYSSRGVIDALQTAIKLHNAGGYTLDAEARFTADGYTTPPYGVCDDCTMREEFFDLMSTSDYIVFAGHGNPTGIFSNSFEPKITIDHMDSIDLDTNNPVIITYNACRVGVLYPNSPTLSHEFMRAGAAAFVGRTTTRGIPAYVGSHFPDEIEGGMRIGDALFQVMRDTVLEYGDSFKADAGQICLHGDPTLRRR